LGELEAAGARVALGGDGRDLLDGPGPARCVVKSPGLAFESPLVSEARKRGVAVLDEAELGWRLDGRPLVGVTGTNGKGTCAALVRAALGAAGYEPILAGNTHFGPPLSEAPDHRGDVLVAELSSFQLAGSPSLLPEASLFTNLGQQHWDYRGSREA
jgi:UDP-N-acetylmuramoylalanine--D-glutamate ligase